MTLRLVHPSRTVVSGPSRAGKSSLVWAIIDNVKEMYDQPIHRIIYCYSLWQPIFDDYKHKGVIFYQGLPKEDFFDGKSNTLLIIDDLVSSTNSDIVNLFTRGSSHLSISIIFITQNIFHKKIRDITLNSTYLIIFKNFRDIGQFSALARQIWGSGYKFAIEAFTDATSRPYGYLLIDAEPTQDDNYRVRTNILPGQQTFVYVDRGLFKPLQDTNINQLNLQP